MEWNTNKTLHYIKSTSQLDQLEDKVANAPYIAVDTETTGLARFAEAIGVGIAISEDESLYIPIKIFENGSLIRPWSDAAYAKILSFLTRHLTASKRLITHNGTFDAKILDNTFQIAIIQLIRADTQLLHHTLYSDPPHGLKPLAAQYITPDASSSQDDLKASAIANGGSWTADNKEMYKGTPELIGRYCNYDCLFTIGLYNRLWLEITKPENKAQLDLFNNEVMPLQKVTYEMETVGIKVDVERAKVMRIEMEQKIAAIEDEIYASVEDQVKEYEFNSVVDNITISPRSAPGKYLMSLELPLDGKNKKSRLALYEWYKQKNNLKRVFNLDSGNDKAYLLYDVMELPCTEMTASGKRSTAKSTLDKLSEKYADNSPIIKMMTDRSKEIKLLSTYINPIIESAIDNRVYCGFKQTGTTSGRYSSGGSSINMQTLPRSDTRIKSLFIPDDNYVFIGADYASLEPRSFSVISGENKIKNIFLKGHDFYSSIAIDVLGLKGVSADPEAENYLGKVDKEARQKSKAFSLAIAYGARPGRLAQMLNCDYNEAEELYDKYISAYPNLKKWMDRCEYDMKTRGYVDGITGRRKRGDMLKMLYTKHRVKDFSKKYIEKIFHTLPVMENYPTAINLYVACNTLINVAKNHCIQSLAASICNTAMIDFYNKVRELNIESYLILSVHDELIVTCKREHSEIISKCLQECMEHNSVTALIDIPMAAEPVITDKSLAEAK